MNSSFNVKIPPLALAILAGGFVWVVSLYTPTLQFSPLATGLVSCILFIAGLLIIAAGVITFRRADTTVDPLNPDKSTELVTSGVYRLTRNPMYLGFTLLLIAETVWFRSPVSLVVPLLYAFYINYFQIIPEEKALTRLFGDKYDKYKSNVRRWF